MMSPKYVQCLALGRVLQKSRKRIRKMEYVILVEKEMKVKWATAKDYVESMIRIGVLKDTGEDVVITSEGEKYL